MNFWIIQGLNGLAFGSLLFILASGFSLIFGLMRIVNLSHGAYFMLGAYVGLSAIEAGVNFWIAILIGGGAICILGAVIERFILRRLTGQPLAQVLVTLGIAFIIADTCVWIWTGDPRPVPMPSAGSRSKPSRSALSFTTAWSRPAARSPLNTASAR